MDLTNLSDVELAKHYLEVAKAAPAPRKALAALEAEAFLRGPERMAAARALLGDEREAAREAADVAAAFVDGRLSVRVDEPTRSSGQRDSMVCGGSAADSEGMVTWVHVMSKPAGGEVRGYAKVGQELRLRLPEYVVEWTALDAEMCRRIGCVRVVRPIPLCPVVG